MTFHRIAAMVAALATAVFLAACSSTASETVDGHIDHSHDTQTAVIAGEPAAFDADDVAFATNMIQHHQQAVELSALVPDRSTNPELSALAQQISAAQEPEIATMKAFLVQWKEDVDGNPDGTDAPDSTGHSGHADMTMSGMVDDATMTKLKSLNGAEFDTLWLQSMIGHHRGAIDMAHVELAKGQSVDAQLLAQNIIDAQQAEIDTMQKMLAGNP